jgi:hypothetical protein
MGWAFVISMIRLAAASVRIAERQQWVHEGQRQYIVAELEAVNRALVRKDKLSKKIREMSDEDLDRLIDSYRR